MNTLSSIAETATTHKNTLHWLDTQQDRMVELAIDWANQNSGSGNLPGLLAMEEKIRGLNSDFAPLFNTIDLEQETRVGSDGVPFLLEPRRILHFSNRIQSSRRILMTGHTDTVFPTDSAFQTVTKLANGHLNGPGLTDMKGGILIMLFALMGLERAGLMDRVRVDILLSPDEETGSLGSGPVLHRFAQNADIGLTYEPALPDGTLAGARKGSGNFTLVVRGKAAHAGREFHIGKNAVVKLAAITTELAALTDSRPELTLNAATTSGGVAPNIVPDLAMMKFNVRLKTAEDGPFIENAIRDVLDKHEEEGFELSLHGGINRPPKVISEANEALMQRVSSIGRSLDLDIRYVATGGCCEGNNLAAAGLPNIDTLGVRGGKIHSDGEFLIPESLSERARLSFLIMASIAEGHLDDIIAQRKKTAL